MKMNEVKEIARERGIVPGRARKIELVRTLQREEGNQACYQTGQADTCGQGSCLWRQDCV